MSKKKYQVFSPDGFTIEFLTPHYPSKKKAMEAFNLWKERYSRQGYYSSTNYGKIPLNELEDYCTLKTI